MRALMCKHCRDRAAGGLAAAGLVLLAVALVLATHRMLTSFPPRDAASQLRSPLLRSPVPGLPAALAAACSPEFRARSAAEVEAGGARPPLLRGACTAQDYAEPARRGGCTPCPPGVPDRIAGALLRRRDAWAAGARALVPCDLFRLLRGRTLWLLGDSVQRYWYHSLRIFLAEFSQGGRGLGEGDGVPPADPAAMEAALGDTTRRYPPACTAFAGGTGICSLRPNLGQDALRWLAELKEGGLFGATPRDVAVANFGLWHGQQGDEYGQLVQWFAGNVSEQAAALPSALWRETSPQHFPTHQGYFAHILRSDAPNSSCAPLQGVELGADGRLRAATPAGAELAAGGLYNQIANPILARHGVPIVRVWDEALGLWYAHTGFTGGQLDCTHFCLPSAPELWAWPLVQALAELPRLQRPASLRARAAVPAGPAEVAHA